METGLPHKSLVVGHTAVWYVLENVTVDSNLCDPAERAREKAASRDEDARAIAAGEKSPSQVRRENASFAFSNVRLQIPARER